MCVVESWEFPVFGKVHQVRRRSGLVMMELQARPPRSSSPARRPSVEQQSCRSSKFNRDSADSAPRRVVQAYASSAQPARGAAYLIMHSSSTRHWRVLPAAATVANANGGRHHVYRQQSGGPIFFDHFSRSTITILSPSPTSTVSISRITCILDLRVSFRLESLHLASPLCSRRASLS